MKKALFLALVVAFVLPVLAAEPIGVVANNNTNSIQLINPLTMELTPSLLKGNLGSYGGGLFDVVIVPNGHYAFVSNFGDSTVYAIDISGGFNGEPTIVGGIQLPFFAEDMDVTPDGKYVLCTDGGFSPRIATIDVGSMMMVKNNYLGAKSAQAVTIHPSGKYVYVADYFGSAIHDYALAADGTVTYMESHYFANPRPVNVTVSPDGKTLITANSNTYYTQVFMIGDDGNLVPTSVVTFPAKGGQSVAFSPDSKHAYYYSNSVTEGAQIQVIDITAPGVATLADTISLSIPRGTSQLFGVDSLAVDPAGKYLYVSNPTVSGGVVEVTVIDLAAGIEVAQLHCNGIPTGVAFGTIQ